MTTNDFTAEQGQAGGASIKITTKSGGHDFHGEAWEYYQTAGLNARPYLATVAANTSAIDPNGAVLRNVFNEYGFNVGGPVYIPKLVTGKKKLFFFDNWERTTRHQLIGNGITLTVPDTNMINGNFSEAAPYATIYDPQPKCDVGQRIYSNRQLPGADLHRRLSQLCMPPELHLGIWRDGHGREHNSCKPSAIDAQRRWS